MGTTVGVLGLQGDYSLHIRMLQRLRVPNRIVRWPEELVECGGLILPGGESTTFMKLLQETGLGEALQSYAKSHAVMGTCAGLITLSTSVSGDSKVKPLGIIDVKVERNAFGRQIDSFVEAIRIPDFAPKENFEGVFIRAPRIVEIGAGVKSMGFRGDEIVMARSDKTLVLTFHPELTSDTRIHEYFVKKMVEG